jgi:hypothetical protein
MNAHAQPVAAVGHNMPPLSPYEAIAAHLEDLLTEARNWADGTSIENQAQADELDRLIGDLKDGMAAAEEKRVEEKAPLDKLIADIQDRYNVYIAPIKNKVPGKVPLALKALLATQTPWLQKLADEKAAEAKRLQDIADEKVRLAREALQAAEPSNLLAREEAEALVTEATQAQRVAVRADKGATAGTGLRSYWSAEIVDLKEACRHFWANDPEAFRPLIQQLASHAVQIGKKDLPGVKAVEDRRAV